MRIFFDSSALAKRYIREKGSSTVEQILRKTSSLGLSVLCIPEVISAMNRRKKESLITEAEYHLTKQALLQDASDADIINLIPRIVGKTIFLLETEDLKTLDAIHVASALEWKAELFVSADVRQSKAAQNAGLKTEVV